MPSSVQSWTGGTISLWVRPIVYAANNKLTVAQFREASSFGHLWLFIHPDFRDVRFQVLTGTTAVEAVATTTINDDTWYHLVATWNKTNNTANVYVNGALEGTVNVPSWGQVTNEFYWGAGFNGYGTRGTIDEVGIWNRPLTPAEVTTLYNLVVLNPDPITLLNNLVTVIQNLNVSQGVANSLDAKLQAVQTALTSAKNNDRPTACNQMNAFDQYVQAQNGKGLTADQSAQLLDASRIIKTALGCP